MRPDPTHAFRALLVVLALAASLREAGSAACQSLCPWGAFTVEGPVAAVAAAPTCGACAARESATADESSGCALPCSPDKPCPLFAAPPPALVERPVVSATAADLRHATVGPIEIPPGATFVVADFDPHAAFVAARLARGRATSATRPTFDSTLWLLDRALLI